MDVYCGGRFLLFLLSIFKVHAAELGTYGGCVLNTFPTLFYYVMPGDMTNENCARFCCFISTNMTFSGTMTEDKCLCRNEKILKVQVSNSCNNRCSGNLSQICGGYSNPPKPTFGPSYYLSLYRLNCFRSTIYQSANTSAMPKSNKTTNTSSISTDNTVSRKLLEVQLDKLRKETLTDKTTTTLYWSKKRCATDNRKSARNLGMFVIIVLILPVCLILGSDFLRVFRRRQ